MTTKIDWCDETINPFTGCRHGCSFCYARRMAHRLGSVPGTVYERVKAVTGDPFAPAIHLDASHRAFAKLRRARKPRRVFVGSMGDMCFEGEALAFGLDGTSVQLHGWTTADTQAHIARRASEQPRHAFLLLTKRPDLLSAGIPWSSNVHLGVSVTGNADEHRLVDLHRWYGHADANTEWNEHRPGVLWASVEPLLDPEFDPEILTGLDWVVIGAQTGPGAPDAWPVVTEAACRIAAWCARNNVPCFVKDNLRKAWPGHPWPRELPEVPQ
jgi:protein gp37